MVESPSEEPGGLDTGENIQNCRGIYTVMSVVINNDLYQILTHFSNNIEQFFISIYNRRTS